MSSLWEVLNQPISFRKNKESPQERYLSTAPNTEQEEENTSPEVVKIFGIRIKGGKEANEATNLTTGGAPRTSLVPDSHRILRETQRVKRIWWRIVVSIFVVVALSLGGFFYWVNLGNQGINEQRAAEEQSRVLLEEYREVSDLITEVNELETTATNLSETSIDWTRLISNINDNLPPSSAMVNFSIGVGQPQDSETYAMVRGDFVSSDPLDYSSIVGSIPSTTSVMLGNLTSSGGENDQLVYAYSVAFGFSEDMLKEEEILDDNDLDIPDSLSSSLLNSNNNGFSEEVEGLEDIEAGFEDLPDGTEPGEEDTGSNGEDLTELEGGE